MLNLIISLLYAAITRAQGILRYSTKKKQVILPVIVAIILKKLYVIQDNILVHQVSNSRGWPIIVVETGACTNESRARGIVVGKEWWRGGDEREVESDVWLGVEPWECLSEECDPVAEKCEWKKFQVGR